MLTKTCKICSSEFKTHDKTSKYCTKDCYHQSLRGSKRPERMVRRLEVECLGCGVKFLTKETRIKKYCTFECYRSKFRNPKLGLKKKCKVCGKDFINTTENQSCCSKECGIEILVKHERDPAKEAFGFCKGCFKLYIHPSYVDKEYCSQDCYHFYMKGSERPFAKTGKYVKCSYCTKTFYAQKNRIDGSEYLYCDLKCRGDHVSLVLGGVSTEKYKSIFTRKVKYNGIIFRSTWEALFAIYLDKKGLTWEYEQRRIPYRLNGRKHNYNPDFYVYETDTYYEIKGLFTDSAKLKMQAVIEQNPNLKIDILRQKDLIKKGVMPRCYAKKGVNNFIKEHPLLEAAH